MIRIEYPNPEILKALSNFGYVGGSCYAPTTTIEGESVGKACLGKDKM
jgi:hypothetical protein